LLNPKTIFILEAGLASFKNSFNLCPSASTFLWILEELWAFMMELINADYNIFLTNGITRAKTTKTVEASNNPR